MKTNSKLLNEVIADAKAVRETAVQTAISRLKETFEPTVRSLISQKLSEEDEYEDEGETVTAEPAPEPAPAPAPEPEPDDFDEELDEILRELEGMDDEMNEMEDEMDLDEMEDELDEYDLDEIIAEMEDEMDLDEMEDAEEEMYERRNRRSSKNNRSGNALSEVRQLKRQLRKAKGELSEAYKAITTQKNVINEVNLLNSKLLFLTKVTSKYNLSPEKQVKVLEAFDRATTVREVKLIYSTICENLNTNTSRKSVNEVASRPTRSVGKGTLNESFNFTARWQELAGIKK